jgi:hypothetical protein
LGLVERDPVEPRRELCARLEAIQSAPRPQEHLLGDILGIARLEPEAPQGAVHAVGVAHDDLLERVLITGPSPLDQRRLRRRGVWGQRAFSRRVTAAKVRGDGDGPRRRYRQLRIR